MIHALLIHVVGIDSAGLLDHLADLLRVFQHRTWPEHILVEGLIVMVSHEQRALQRVQQADVMDIAVGIVNEHTGLHIALGIDVQITAAAGNTAADKLGVILEIHGEDGFGAAVLPNAAVHGLTLFGGRQ